MSAGIPENYNPRNPWRFPAERLVFVANAFKKTCKAYVDDFQKRYRYPDQRFVVFQEMYGLALDLQVQALTYAEYWDDYEWWRKYAERLEIKPDDRILDSLKMGMRAEIQSIFYDKGELIVRDALVQIFEALGDLMGASGMGAQGFSGELENLGLEKYRSLPQLLEYIRTTVRYGWKFCPEDGEDQALEYKHLRMVLLNREELIPDTLGFTDDWEFLTWLLSEGLEMVRQLIETPATEAIGFIKTRHL